MARHRDRPRGSRGVLLRRVADSTIPACAALAALAATAFMAAAANAQQPAAGAPLVFEGVTVVDVEQGKLVPDQRVVVTGTRIEAVGGSGAVQMPKNAQVVNAKGKYLIPGLWDLHTHPRRYADDFFYPLFIAHGVTGIRDCWSEIPLDTLVEWRREILAGTRVGPPRQLLSGEAISESDSEAAQTKVDELKAAGANIIKTYPFSFELAAAARRAGLPFGGHINGDISVMDASDSGVAIIDHVNTSGGLDQVCWAEAATVEQCQPLAEKFKRNGTWFVPTLVRMHNHQLITTPRSEAVFAQMSKRVEKFWAGATPSALASERAVSDAAGSKAAASDSLGAMSVMHRVGLPILAGTDAGAPVIREMPPGFALHAELEMYVAEGLTPLEALQTSTLNPAKLIHGTDSLGSVAAGKLADLVLLDADPLANIANTTAIRAVVANGRYYDRDALDRLLTDAQAKAKDEAEPFGNAR